MGEKQAWRPPGQRAGMAGEQRELRRCEWEEPGAGAQQARWGQTRAGFPEAPQPTPLPPGSGISGVRAEGQPHPLLPSGSGIPPAKGVGVCGGRTAASASVQVGSHWTRNCSASTAPHPHPSPWAGPQPPPPSPAGTVCARHWQKTNPPGWVCRELGNLDTVAAVANGRHTLRLFWGDCCRC